MQLSRALFLGLAAALASVVACSSATSGFGISGGGGVSGEGSTSAGPVGGKVSSASTCPMLQPTAGQSCGLATCEYGSDPDPSCNVIARCSQTASSSVPYATWEIFPPTNCPTTCPQHYDERVPGAACDGPDVCTYREATCGCAGATGQSPIGTTGDGGNEGGDAASPDSGAAPIGRWQCVRPDKTCPARRPVPGTSCSRNMICDYGTCLFGVPLTFECTYGAWAQPTSPACP